MTPEEKQWAFASLALGLEQLEARLAVTAKRNKRGVYKNLRNRFLKQIDDLHAHRLDGFS